MIQALGELKLYAVDKDFFFRIGRSGKELREAGTARQPQCGADGSGFDGVGTYGESGIFRRRIRDRARARVAAILGRRDRVGRARAAPYVFPGAEFTAIHSRGIGERDHRWLGRAGCGGVALYRAADRSGRNDGGRGVHALPHAQESDIEPGTRAGRVAARNSSDGNAGAHRALHVIEDGVRDDRCDVRADDRALHLFFGQRSGRRGGGGGDADRWIHLRDGFRKPCRDDRIVQQSDLGIRHFPR